MRTDETRNLVSMAVAACEAKKGANITVLELDKNSSGFTDYFVICTGNNPRQVQAISDEVDRKLSEAGHDPRHKEGYNQAEWILLDYVDFVIHVFSETARKFYDLERLWKSATSISVEDLKERAPRKAAARKTAPAKTAARSGRTAPRKAAKKTPVRPRKRT